MDGTSYTSKVAFYIGLFGIVVSGLLVGIGGDNYWGLAHVMWFTPSVLTGKYTAILGAVAFYVVLSDVVAFGVVFAGAVVFVQRLRGRI
jgi:hypothetical protein